ncbi:unnamed protein product [Scytosiphon promiscuus]
MERRPVFLRWKFDFVRRRERTGKGHSFVPEGNTGRHVPLGDPENWSSPGARDGPADCYECRSLMMVPANHMLADMIDKDVGRWIMAWLGEATAFKALYNEVPPFEHFPGVTTPTWSSLSNNINAGGLRNYPHQPHSTGRGHSRAPPRGAVSPGAGRSNYCWAFASTGGCSRTARGCKFLHAVPPGDGNRSGKGHIGRKEAGPVAEVA